MKIIRQNTIIIDVDRFRWLCEPGSVGGGRHSWLTVLSTDRPGVQTVMDASGYRYRAETIGRQVRLIPRFRVRRPLPCEMRTT